MSYEAMHKVRASGLSDRTQVDVLEALAFFLNKETGACFPSTEAISRISRVNDRLVRTTLKTLHSLGLISSTQKAGQKRYFTLHLDRLPLPIPLQEVTGGQENAGGEESTPLYENTPLQESTGEGCRKIQGTPVGKCSTPLYETTPEQGINKESNKEGNKEDSAPAEGDTFNPSEWALKQSPKNGTLESTENGTLVQQSTKSGTFQSTENGTTESTKNGTHESTVFGPVTGNKNREIEQGSRTRNSLPAQALWETDHLDDDVKKIEKPKATRAKPKTSCPFSPDDPIPPEYLEYARAKHPSINAQTEFTKFVNFHLSKDNRYSNWLAAWRTWATKAEEFAKSRPQSQSYTPARRSTDPQAGWVSTQTPTNPPPLYTPEEREAMKKKYQAMTAIFAKTDKNV